MQADWYVDPMGRYEGRFFDGETWTDQVSDQGLLSFDPDWPTVGYRGQDSAGEARDSMPVDSGRYQGSPAQPAVDQTAWLIGSPSHPDLIDTSFGGVVDSGSAVQSQGNLGTPDQAEEAAMVESVGRAVAVVDPELVARVTEDAAARAYPEVHLGSQNDESRPRGSRKGLKALASLLLVGGLGLALIAHFALSDDDGETDERAEPSTEARLADQGAASATPGDSGLISREEIPSPTDADDSIQPTGAIRVGTRVISNGAQVLDQLRSEYLHDENHDTASCWFGELDGRAVLTIFCGPIGGDARSPLYDPVSFRFDNPSEQVVTVQAASGDPAEALSLPSGVVLIDADERHEPHARPERGLREPRLPTT